MTTIIADRRSMAADSQVSWEGNLGFKSPKLFRIGNSIYGISGDNWGNVFIEWAKTGFNEKKKPQLHLANNWEDIDFDVLELAPTGLYLWDKHFVRIELKDDNYSIGSGSKFAIAFMRKMNMSPEEAVKECCNFDDYTREPVDVMTLIKEENEKVSKKI